MFNFFKNQSGVSVVEAFEQTKDNNKNILIDVREESEYKNGHAKNALSFPLSYLSEKEAEELKKYENVYVICQSGGRSLRAVDFLLKQDVSAINVEGGTFAWVREKLPM